MFDDCLSLEYLNISNFNINKIYFDDVVYNKSQILNVQLKGNNISCCNIF